MTGPSDKITITQYPPLPSLCCICNFSADGKRRFLDFQMSVDIYGAVAICEECIAPVAKLFGFVSIDRLETSEAHLEAALQNVEGFRRQNERLNVTLDSIFSIRPDLADRDNRNESMAHQYAEKVITDANARLEASRRSDTKLDESVTSG